MKSTFSKVISRAVLISVVFAILQTFIGLFWEDEITNSFSVFCLSLSQGCFYLICFFLCTRKHPTYAFLIFILATTCICLILCMAIPSLASAFAEHSLTVPNIIRLTYAGIVGVIVSCDTNPIAWAIVLKAMNTKSENEISEDESQPE